MIATAAAGTVAVTAFFLLRSDTRDAETPTSRASAAPTRAAPVAGTRSEGVPAEEPPQPATEPTRREPSVEEPIARPAETAPAVGTLRIQTDVRDAQVFIDRQFVGTAPALAENVAPGRHQLNVSAEGFESYAGTIDVVHRHGIGSCRGRLVATPQGLRYETDNRDDAFTVPLVEMETFQVDYLAKNLRVKLPKGRQLNFTDPDGNADRLFVFHRDVDRARERLRKGDPPASD